MKSEAIPRLRFKGFNDKWKNDKLKNLAQFINGKAFKQRDLLNKGKYPVIRVGNFYTDKKIYYSNKELPNKYYLNNKDLLYTWSATFGPHIWHGGKVIYHYHIWKIICKSAYKYFLLQLLNIDKNHIQKNGSTMAHITKYGMETKKVTIPSLSEQQLIGKFFAKLDKLIQLQQKKVSLLKKLKRGYLQKLFPRKGELVPRLRFKGFHDKWCCIKLGNIGKIKSGTGFPNKEQGGQKGIPFFKVSDMNLSKNNILMNVSSNYVTQNQIDNRHWKPIKPTNGAIIFAKVGAALMKNRKRLINKPFLIDNNLMSYSFNNRWNKHFGLNYFINIYLPKFAQTGALPSFNATSISTIRILLPSLKEQDKIGEFFDNISSLINLQHNKVICLRKLKKAYLQKMFC